MDKIEKQTDETTEQPQTDPEAEPRKLLLGKRVIRHFDVRSGVQTGAGTESMSTMRTGFRTC